MELTTMGNKTTKGCIALLIVLMLIGVWGCTGQSQNRKDPYAKWRAMAETNVGHSPVAREHALEMPPKHIETIGAPTDAPRSPRPLPQSAVSLKMHLTEVQVLLRALARSVNLNIMINDGVSGRMSINVENTPWDKVFIGVLNSQALDYEWEGDIVRIITLDDRDRRLKNLEAEEKILSKQQEIQKKSPQITKIIPIDFANAEKVRDNIEKVLNPKEGGEPSGAVMIDAHTNSLIVQATPSQISQIVPMITELDRPTPQILIEAYIVETNSDTARELGIQWSGRWYSSGANTWVSPNALGGLSDTGFGLDHTVKPGPGINFPANLAAEGPGFLLGMVNQGKRGLLAVELSALEKAGRLNILSSPSITTLDNTKAIIESGEEVPIPVVSDNTANVIYKEALLSLEVTPHVIQQDALKLEIVTVKNELKDASVTSVSVGNYPTILTKKASTNVILFDGQTTVIGGLRKDTNIDGNAGVPGLSKVPLLGNFFKSQSKSDQMQEMLIFITPRILKPLTEVSAAEGGTTPGRP